MISQEFLDLFNSKLNLENMSKDIQTSFIVSMTKYLDHGRKDIINGRTLAYISLKLDNLINLLECINLSKIEIVKALTNLPNILNGVDDLYNKYLLLGIVENEENNLRKDKLINKTKDFMVGLPKIYARYCLIEKVAYESSWNSLVHSSDKEFANMFVKGTYQKPYQVFESINQVLDWLNNVNIENLDIEYFKSLKVNEELVEKYEGKIASKGKN